MVTAVLRRACLALVVAALVVLAGLSLNRVYSGWLLVQLVAGAAVAAALLSALGRRLWGWVVAIDSLGAMTGYALWAVDLSARAGGVPGDVRAFVFAGTLRTGIDGCSSRARHGDVRELATAAS